MRFEETGNGVMVFWFPIAGVLPHYLSDIFIDIKSAYKARFGKKCASPGSPAAFCIQDTLAEHAVDNKNSLVLIWERTGLPLISKYVVNSTIKH